MIGNSSFCTSIAALTWFLAHEFARRLKARGRGGIIFVSSIASFSPIPLWANYAASKAYEASLGEAMHAELRPFGVDVLVLCPGPVPTEFYEVGDQDLSKMPGEMKPMVVETPDVVKTALTAVGVRSKVVAGGMNKLLMMLSRVAPRSFVLKQFSSFPAATRRHPSGPDRSSAG